MTEQPMMYEVPAGRLETLREAESLIKAIREIVASEQHRIDRMHECHWEILGISRPEGPARPRHPRMDIIPGVTRVLLKCSECKILMTQSLEGDWTEDQIKGETNAASD